MEKVNVKTTKTSRKKLESNQRYNDKNTTLYSVRMNNQLYKILEKAFSENEKYNNKMSYTIQAVREKLERDGYL